MKKTLTTLCPALLLGLLALGLAACNGKKFTVAGTVSGAQDSTLYFERVGLTGIEPLDSVKLPASGAFTFSQPATEAPEFYRLRIHDQIINVSIDSTETVNVKAEYPQMAVRYEVSGSDNCEKIRELALMQIALQQQAIDLERAEGMTADQARDSLNSLISAYKEKVKTAYIFHQPYKAYAYFALFQTLGPWLIFNPRSSRDDVRVFSAVATSWDTYYPGSERGENLHNIAIEGMKNIRIMEAKQRPATIDAGKVETAGVIDIALTDKNGQERRLTDLKGQVVLLDFHLFSLQDSPARILMLRELYNKYHDKGFEIFQVSLDPDEHLWRQLTDALPWICVRDAAGINSSRLQLYNVQSLPEYFLIDRGNNLVKRSEQMTSLENEIKAHL